MPDVPVAEAMEEAQAVIDTEVLPEVQAVLDAEAALASAPVQVPLFEPPPFDFEQAYDELHRLDARARLRKSAWEIAKSDASDAKKSYDTAIEDLHNKFAEIERARSEAQRPHASHATTEGGDPQMPELDETIDEVPDEVPQEPTPETDAPSD